MANSPHLWASGEWLENGFSCLMLPAVVTLGDASGLLCWYSHPQYHDNPCDSLQLRVVRTADVYRVFWGREDLEKDACLSEASNDY